MVLMTNYKNQSRQFVSQPAKLRVTAIRQPYLSQPTVLYKVTIGNTIVDFWRYLSLTYK